MQKPCLAQAGSFRQIANGSMVVSLPVEDLPTAQQQGGFFYFLYWHFTDRSVGKIKAFGPVCQERRGDFFFEGAFMRGKSHDCAVRGGGV